MKSALKFVCRRRSYIITFVFVTSLLLQDANGQGNSFITGKLTDGSSGQAIPYATIALIRKADSIAVNGTLSDEEGHFSIGPVMKEKYRLYVSNIGYKPASRDIEVINDGVTNAGIFVLQDISIMLNELIITGERTRAKAENDKTSYYITEKMINASATGTDILKLVPGVQVDMMQNISVEGSRAIMIYVDGREREKGFISQLKPEDIDKIEIISIPSSEYDSHLTGAINIIMKKNMDSGISGQVLVEVPTSRSMVYIFPAYSLSYSIKKMNLYTSYNGEITFLNQLEKFSREYWNKSDTVSLETKQEVKQRNWSNKFHYGLDYFLNERNQFNFYAYINPYSQELDGQTTSQITGIESTLWQAGKDDKDRNRSTFYSLYYKHSFNDKGMFTSDISFYNLKAENTTLYYGQDNGNEVLIKNSVKPDQDMLSIKIDYSDQLFRKVEFNSGIKAKFQMSKDRLSDFEYHENVFAAYTNIEWNPRKFNLTAGMRVEESGINLKETFTRKNLSFFPHASFRYKISTKQSLQLSYSRSIKRPNLLQLNPYTNFDDLWSTTTGNPYLRPELLRTVNFQHSIQFNGNYLSPQVFFKRADNVINNMTHIEESGKFETTFNNAGYMSQYGVQLSGSLKINILTLSPFIKVYKLHTSGNYLAKNFEIENKNLSALESGLSAIFSFKHDLSLSLNIQYNSSQYDIQSRYFSDIVYFLSMEKTFKNKYRVGIVSLPIPRDFTYNGSEVRGVNFHTLYKGQVILSKFPVWFRVGYTFSSGKNRDKINRAKEEVENLRKKGF